MAANSAASSATTTEWGCEETADDAAAMAAEDPAENATNAAADLATKYGGSPFALAATAAARTGLTSPRSRTSHRNGHGAVGSTFHFLDFNSVELAPFLRSFLPGPSGLAKMP